MITAPAPVPSFRAASTDDLATLASLAQRIWRAHYPAIIPREQIEHMLERMYAPEAIAKELADGVVYELAVLDGEPVGYLAYERFAVEPVLFLHKCYLLTRLHGRGPGAAMLARVDDAAVAAGAKAIRLLVNKANTRAIAAYRRHGYRITVGVRRPFGEWMLDDWRMEKDLAGG